MRIIWNDTENWFQAELSLDENWRDDMELVKGIGFKTTGSPSWMWYTSKISTLNKLRDSKPKSGLVITEVALQKYKFLSEQAQKKAELKKTFQKEKLAAENNVTTREEYTDPVTGMTGFVVKPSTEPFTWKFIPPTPPDVYCFICGDPVYFYDYPDMCLWCSKS